MLKLFAPGAVVAFCGIGLLVGCAAPSPPAPDPAAAAATASAPLTLDTPVQTIVAAPGGKAVLDRDVPGLTASASYGMIKLMSLNQLQPLSGGKLTATELQHVQTDLAQLPAP